MKIDSMLFDLDGTLWNATYTTTRFFESRLRELEYPITIEQPLVQSAMGLLVEEIAQIYFKDFPAEKRVEMMLNANEGKAAYLKQHGGILYPDVEATLEKLSKRYKLFLVSNCTEEYLDAFFSAHGLQKYFADYENSGRTKMGKAHNIKLVVERNQLQNPVYIGDIEKDRLAAVEAGIPFVFAAYGFGDVQKYDAKIEQFNQLLEL